MYLVSTFKLSSLLSVNYLIPHSVIYNSKRTLESKKVLLVIHRDNGYKLELNIKAEQDLQSLFLQLNSKLFSWSEIYMYMYICLIVANNSERHFLKVSMFCPHNLSSHLNRTLSFTIHDCTMSFYRQNLLLFS